MGRFDMAAGDADTVAMAREAHGSRAEFVYQTIRDDIRRGRLRPGERLREVELAARLDVSRTPIREAIRRLVENGLVSRGAGGGLAVTVLDEAQMQELYEVRSVLEGAAASFAAQHASTDDIFRMRTLAESCRAASSPADSAMFNTELHKTLHATSRNRYLALLQVQFSDWLLLLSGTTFATEGRAESAYREHVSIIDAIEARDPEQARRAAMTHIRAAYRTRTASSL
jgi:DNA-binding GntR family transcriptional regulator